MQLSVSHLLDFCRVFSLTNFIFSSISLSSYPFTPYSLPCIPGEYQNEEGTDECKPCAAKTYSNSKKRNTTCDTCPSGRISTAGSVKCSSCSAGQYVEAFTKSCQKCPAGYVSNAPDSMLCMQCGINNKGESSNTENTICNSCDLGQYQPTPGTCEECKPGQYASDKGLKSCAKCPVDTYLPDLGKKKLVLSPVPHVPQT